MGRLKTTDRKIAGPRAETDLSYRSGIRSTAIHWHTYSLQGLSYHFLGSVFRNRDCSRFCNLQNLREN